MCSPGVAMSRAWVYAERKIGRFGSTPTRRALEWCRRTLTSASAATLRARHPKLCGWMLATPELKRILRVIYVRDPAPDSVLVVTAYQVTGKPLVAFRRRMKKKRK